MSLSIRFQAIAAAASLPLLALYLAYLGFVSVNVSPIVVNWVEGVILLTQLARLAVVVVWPRLRRARFPSLFIVFSAEMLAMVPVAVLSYLLSSQYLGEVAEYMFISWPAAASLVLPPFASYRLFHDISNKEPLASVFPSAAAQFGIVSLLLTAAMNVPRPIFGLSGLTQATVSRMIGPSPVIGLATGDPLYYLLSMALYGSLLAYFLFRIAGPPGPLLRQLALVGLVSFVLAAWLLVGGSMTSSSFYLLAAPCGLFTLALWWSTRG
jgi:hypothetical protein